MLSDETLLQTFVRDRSRAAFEEILRRHGGLVFGVCRRSLGSLQEAEDAAQSVFLLFLEKAPRLGRGTVLSAWLYRSAVFVSRNQLRARIRRESRLPEPATPAAPPAWEEAKPHLDDALARLPQRLQDALVVHYLQGQSLAETAATLDCPLKTLEKRVSRGLQRMRELLAGAGVAIGSATLVALLEQEARAAAPARLSETFRATAIPPAASPTPLTFLRKLLFPAAAALVAIGFVSGALRMSANRGSRLETLAPHLAAGNARLSAAEAAAPSTAPTGGAATSPRRPFPATFEEFRALYKRLLECPEDAARWEALGIGVNRDDLRAVVNRAKYSPSWVDPMIVDLFREWAEREPRLAADWLYRAYALLPTTGEWKIHRPVGSGPGNVTMFETVLDAWYRREPAEVETWMKGLPPGVARDAVVVEVAIVASRLDPERSEDLAAILDTLPPGWSRRVATARVAEQWATRDPKAAAAWILKLPPHGPGEKVGTPTFTLAEPGADPGLAPLATINDDVVTERDVPTLVEARPKENDLAEARMSALMKIAQSWAASDLAAARLWSEGLEDPLERAKTMEIIGGVWAGIDPRAALDYARAHPGAEWRDDWLEMVAERLVLSDRDAAESILRMVSPASSDQIRSQVLRCLATERPEEAARETVAIMLHRDWEDAQLHYYNALWESLAAWTQRDAGSVVAFANAIQESKVKETAISIIGHTWAALDPVAALDWVLQLPGEAKDDLLGTLVGELAATDLERAWRMAADLSPLSRSRATYGIATAWAQTAPETALAWARSMPGRERDWCIRHVLSAWAKRDADAALAQVSSIGDEVARVEATRAIHESRIWAARAKLRTSLLGREEGK
jgi:RNA polymerase sigma factor (sigma-70 family)